MLQEFQYLMGKYKETKQGRKLAQEGLIHKLQKQLTSLYNEAPRTNIANALQT
eukprot:SAG11_NODE_44005_length_159_cov_245.483333_1_plen_52_part_11